MSTGSGSFKVHQLVLMTSTLFLCKTISCNFALGSNLLASYRHSLCPRLLPWGPSPPFFNNCLLFPCSGCLSLYNCAALSSASPSTRCISSVFANASSSPWPINSFSKANTSDKLVLPPWELGTALLLPRGPFSRSRPPRGPFELSPAVVLLWSFVGISVPKKSLQFFKSSSSEYHWSVCASSWT